MCMKKSKKILSLILFLCFNQFLVNAQTIQPIERSVGKLNISIDPRMEVLTTVQLLAYSPYNRHRNFRENLRYSKDIVNYFKTFSSHEAVIITGSLIKKNGFGDDVPVTFMLHLSHLPELDLQVPFTDGLMRRSGGGDNLEQYRKSINNFTEISDFEIFWNSKISFYNKILDLTIAKMGKMDLVKVLGRIW